jgi:hypothetical protein
VDAGGCLAERGGNLKCNKDKDAVDGSSKVAQAVCIVWLERKNALKGGPGMLKVEWEQR